MNSAQGPGTVSNLHPGWSEQDTAQWARMCAGTREDGSVIEPNDPYWDSLLAAAGQAREKPRSRVEQQQIYADLGSEQAFVDAFERWLTLIWESGSEAAIAKYCGLPG